MSNRYWISIFSLICCKRLCCLPEKTKNEKDGPYYTKNNANNLVLQNLALVILAKSVMAKNVVQKYWSQGAESGLESDFFFLALKHLWY